MKKNQIAIYGVGGFAREVAWLVETCNENKNNYEVVCYIDDNPEKEGKEFNGYSVVNLRIARKLYPDAKVVIGVGSPQTRQAIVRKAVLAGYSFTTIIHPGVEMSPWVKMGDGTVICAGNILTTNITLGRQVQINLGCTVGHDVVMEDYVTLAPGVHVSGWVHLGKRVYVGTGAVIINGTEDAPIRIGDDAIIGAGACVIESVARGLTVAGVPAKPVDIKMAR
jgi:sugar O-acyltransferase (sialic acid O-acetyltransferase NeuD family)